MNASVTTEPPRPGEPFTIPKGTPVHSMGTGRWHESKRKQTVWPLDVNTYDGEWVVIRWPGAGGYWRRAVMKGGKFVDRWPGTEPA